MEVDPEHAGRDARAAFAAKVDARLAGVEALEAAIERLDDLHLVGRQLVGKLRLRRRFPPEVGEGLEHEIAGDAARRALGLVSVSKEAPSLVGGAIDHDQKAIVEVEPVFTASLVLPFAAELGGDDVVDQAASGLGATQTKGAYSHQSPRTCTRRKPAGVAWASGSVVIQ